LAVVGQPGHELLQLHHQRGQLLVTRLGERLEFQRLRAEKARRDEKADLSPRREVTKQGLDAEVKP
jgi:hypothetical protein